MYITCQDIQHTVSVYIKCQDIQHTISVYIKYQDIQHTVSVYIKYQVVPPASESKTKLCPSSARYEVHTVACTPVLLSESDS